MNSFVKVILQYIVLPLLTKWAKVRYKAWQKTEELAKLRKENLELKLEKAKKYAKDAGKKSSNTDFSNMP